MLEQFVDQYPLHHCTSLQSGTPSVIKAAFQAKLSDSQASDGSSSCPKIQKHPRLADMNQSFSDADDAVADIRSGSTILTAGFGLSGTADGYALPIRDSF